MTTELAKRIARRFEAKGVKLTPAQLLLLARPGDIKKENSTVNKLVGLGYLKEEKTGMGRSYWVTTEEGREARKEQESKRVPMTEDALSSVARMFDGLHVETRVDRDRNVVQLSIADPAHGNIAVREVDWVPTEVEAKQVVKSLQDEIKQRGKDTRTRWRHIPR